MRKKLFRKKDIGAMLREAGATGELKRSLSVTNLVTLGIGAIVGTGIFVITGSAAASYAGPALTVSFLLSAVGCILTAFCYAEFAAMIPLSGSVYSYGYTTMGELLAWFIGWDLILEYLFSCSTVAVGWSGYMLSLLESIGIHIPKHIAGATFIYSDETGWALSGSIVNFPALFIVALVTAFLFGGIRQSAIINNVIVVVKVAVILLFIGFGLWHIDSANWTPYIPENTGEFGKFGWSGILRGAGVIFFAYLGFDALATAAQESRNPRRDMPKGILISLTVCAALYVAVTAVLTGIVSYKELNVSAPLALAVDRIPNLSWLSPLIKLGAIAGLSSVILVMMLGQTRIYYAISKDGLLPPFLSRIHPKYRTPHKATIFAGAATCLIAGIFPINVLGELVSIGTLMAFVIVCISVVVLRRTRPELHRPFKTPFVPFVPILGALVCLAQMLSLPWGTWARLIGWMILGFVIYFAYGIKRSKLN
ncbi:MAG: amino acid permease [Prevotellaceae bacterium]|jgi:APA family basic amino acid/polyamine antiporter|nr:amino acid permease [Prevotellaceae bacterium]